MCTCVLRLCGLAHLFRPSGANSHALELRWKEFLVTALFDFITPSGGCHLAFLKAEAAVAEHKLHGNHARRHWIRTNFGRHERTKTKDIRTGGSASSTVAQCSVLSAGVSISEPPIAKKKKKRIRTNLICSWSSSGHHEQSQVNRPRADDPLPGQRAERWGEAVRLWPPVAQLLHLPIRTLSFEEQEAGCGRRKVLWRRIWIRISAGLREGVPFCAFHYCTYKP